VQQADERRNAAIKDASDAGKKEKTAKQKRKVNSKTRRKQKTQGGASGSAGKKEAATKVA